tara:strand:+ start:5187 stop:6476 length:1290 start_codon:yes stop_codon:yes gene_type:complete
MLNNLREKKESIAVIGLGYVGLPLALAFAKKYKVIGFDINQERVKMLKENKDPSKELDSSAFSNCDITFTDTERDLENCICYIITVPTPIDDYKVPNLKPLLSATKTVGQLLKKGDYVIYESTVYPGCTEEDCIPLLEELSGLNAEKDFYYGYSPERINPGDKEHTVCSILKVVSGNSEYSAKEIEHLYSSIIHAGVYVAKSIRVAEAAKIIENTQRDINIAFMNELSILFDKMNIDTKSVIEAASTKWNFLKFYPGLVGGHCIGVDPYYLAHKAIHLGYSPKIISNGRSVNDGIPTFLAKKLVQLIVENGFKLSGEKVLVQGITFKENVSDIRNSKVAELIRELESFGLDVDTIDPLADPKEVSSEYGITLIDELKNQQYVAVVLAVPHDEFFDLGINYNWLIEPFGILMDIKGVLNDKPHNRTYWRM